MSTGRGVAASTCDSPCAAMFGRYRIGIESRTQKEVSKGDHESHRNSETSASRSFDPLKPGTNRIGTWEVCKGASCCCADAERMQGSQIGTSVLCAVACSLSDCASVSAYDETERPTSRSDPVNAAAPASIRCIASSLQHAARRHYEALFS